MRRALLVGSNFSALPLLNALKKRGIEVSVCGNRPDEVCHKAADRSFFVDYSDAGQLAKLVREERFDFLVPTGNDCSYRVSARVAGQFGFAGFDNDRITEIIHTKGAFRQACLTAGLRIPGFDVVEGAGPAPDLPFPLIVKPVNSYSGQGVSKVENRKELEDALKKVFDQPGTEEAIVEEFFDGSLHSHSAFIRDRKIFLDFFVDEFCTVYPYQVNCSNHPSGLSGQIRNSIREQIERLAASLELGDGLLHTQFLVDAGGDFRIVEAMRRCPGDLFGSLVERSTGIDYADWFVRPFLGEEYPELAEKGECEFWARHTLSTDMSQLNFSFTHDLPVSAQEIVALQSNGYALSAAPYGKTALLFMKFPDLEQLLLLTPVLAKRVKLKAVEEMK